jgi:hypothetical protein
MAIGYWSGSPKITGLLEDQGINGRTILRSISKKQGERMWTGIIEPTSQSSSRFL